MSKDANTAFPAHGGGDRHPPARVSRVMRLRPGIQSTALRERLSKVRRAVGGLAWLILGVALVARKAHALAGLLHHRVEVIALIGLILALSVLRTRPVSIALTIAALFAFALDPRSPVLGVALGFAAFTLLLALSMAIATVLQARQNHDRTSLEQAPAPRPRPGL